LNPKAVTNNEFYGLLNQATRDWQDGLLSVIMRNLSKLTNENPKWIVLDDNIDHKWIVGRDFRAEFSQMWKGEWRNVVFPQQGTVFDYYVSNKTNKFAPWTEIAPVFEYDPERDVSSTLIFAPEYIRNEYISRKLLEGGHAAMFTGFAGTGKSVLAGYELNS
jgi:hypothetical protein